MKKTLISYSNCQGIGLLHFLKKTPLAQEYDMEQWNNWQLILQEQSRDAFYAALPRADLLIYQPTGDMTCTDGAIVPNVDALIAKYVKPGIPKISYGYIYNSGFFPFIKAGPSFDGWITSRSLKKLVRGVPGNIVLSNYEEDMLFYDCALRFAENLAEEARREKECTISMADFILQNFQKQRLFLSQNHPANAIFIELARRILVQLDYTCDGAGLPTPLDQPFPENEAGLPGVLSVHPAVVRELGLQYGPDADYSFYRTWLKQWTDNLDQ